METMSEQPEQECDNRQITFLDESGDLDISWTPDRDAQMLNLIQKKMDEGIRFFILKQTFGIFRKKTYISSVDDIKDRSVSIADRDIAPMFASGQVAVTKTPPNVDFETVGVAKKPEQVVSNRTLAVRPLVGG